MSMHTLKERVGKLKLKDDFDLDITESDLTEVSTPTIVAPTVSHAIDIHKKRIDLILEQAEKDNCEPVIEIVLLAPEHAEIVFDFFKHSTKNYWPFAQAIRSKCTDIEKVAYELWPWAENSPYYNIYFWCFLQDSVSLGEPIMIWWVVAGITRESKEAEIGWMTRNDSKGKWFWTNSVNKIVEFFYTHPDYKKDVEYMTSVVVDSSNSWAMKMLDNNGFRFKKSGIDGQLYVRLM